MALGFICYDDACHLKKFARDPARASLTDQSKQLASVEMVVDRMHMIGHVDPWCKEHCDADKIPELAKVRCKYSSFYVLVHRYVEDGIILINGIALYILCTVFYVLSAHPLL